MASAHRKVLLFLGLFVSTSPLLWGQKDTTKIKLKTVDVRGLRKSSGSGGTISLDSRSLRDFGTAVKSIENLIKSLPGVVGQDELSAQYNVRGGNYDENLTYINGFEIFKPLLARSGQQEGLSSINPDLVSHLTFQAGGFGAAYGDKMASVLDVRYRIPTETAVRADIGILGQYLAVEGKTNRFSISVAGRHRSNQQWSRGLDTKGEFRSEMRDVQSFAIYRINERHTVEALIIGSSNDYRIVPESRQTEFGTVAEVLRLNVYFEGQENYTYTTGFAGLRWLYASDRWRWETGVSTYRAQEEERSDVVSAYRLGELNTNLGSDEFGEVSYWRGTGGYHRYARNRLFSVVNSGQIKGVISFNNSLLQVGIEAQHQDFRDRLFEWENIDSAGYSIPHRPTGVYINGNDTVYAHTSDLVLFHTVQDADNTQNLKSSAFAEWSGSHTATSGSWRWRLGARVQHHTRNGEMRMSPRAGLEWTPELAPSWKVRTAVGWYHQPLLLREMRSWTDGQLHPQRLSQQAFHAIVATEKTFVMNDRLFVWISEIYAKDLRRLVPYDQDGLRLRYAPTLTSRGWMAGWDNRVHGEFIPGTESWISFSAFRALEDIAGDDYGWIRRPTDQRFSFAINLEDRLPKDPSIRVNVSITVVGGFPFGVPGQEKTPNVFEAPPYRRMDLGFLKVVCDPQRDRSKDKVWQKPFEKFVIGIDAFNLLEIRNTASYFWVMDISSARHYAVPNYLTNRLFSIKCVATF